MDKVLGASKAGFPCSRNLWYTVNGCEGKKKDTQTQRIFDVGTYLEPLIVEWLREDGWEVEYNPGSQDAELKIEIPVVGGKLAGHPDCIISKGEIQNALVDIKTMNDHAFTHWKREGTQKTKAQYVTQLHIYAMGLKAMGRQIESLGIVGVNKNNSEMYIDLFPFDEIYGNNLLEKARSIFVMTEPPELNCPTEDWACKYCEFSDHCELYKKVEAAKLSDDPLPVTEDEAVINAMKDLKKARDQLKEAKELEAQAKATLDEKVRNKKLKGIQGGGYVFRMVERKTSIFDTTSFKKAHPELVSKFMKSSASLMYEIKECGE